MTDPIQFEPLGKNDLPSGYFEQDMVVPVTGTMGGGFTDSRDGGLRKHNAGDIIAPDGTPLVAPGNMEFIDGKQGGTNLRSNDWWSHWKDTDTGRIYKFAHHGPISDYKPGDRISKGDVWGSVGNAIEGPHLHMAVYDPSIGKNVDWMKPLGLKRGTQLGAGFTFAQALGNELERKASKIAGPSGGINFEPLSPEELQPTKEGGQIAFEPINPPINQTTPPQPSMPGIMPNLKATPTPLYEMGNQNLLGSRYLDPETMKQATLNPPNMGYRPNIVRPMLNAVGMAGGGLVGGGAGMPLGPAGIAAGTVGGGTLGYGMSQKIADALDAYMGGRPIPTLQESLTKTAIEDIPTGTKMMMGGELIPPVLQGVLRASGNVAKPVLGRLGGTGTKNVEEALQGGEQFTKALRGKITGEEIVQNARDAVQSVRDVRANAYQTQLANISPPPGTTAWDLDMVPIQNKLRDLMGNYRIKINPEGGIDTSAMAMGKSGRDDIEQIINEVWGWKDKSPLGLDALKRRLDDFYSPSSQARAFVTNLRNQVKDTLVQNLPEYGTMTKDYAEATQMIKDFETGLMTRKQGMTGRVTADMTLRRLTSAMRDNFALRGELVDALGGQAATDLSGQIAGYNMRSVLPHGLAGTGPVLAGEVLLAKFVNPKIWPVLIASSPRVQGEFLRVFGKGLQETKGMTLPVGKVMSYLTFLPKSENKIEEQ